MLDYAAFAQLIWQLEKKGVLSEEDIERMYGHRIATLVAHPLVFDAIRKVSFAGPRILAFRMITKQVAEKRVAAFPRAGTRKVEPMPICEGHWSGRHLPRIM